MHKINHSSTSWYDLKWNIVASILRKGQFWSLSIFYESLKIKLEICFTKLMYPLRLSTVFGFLIFIELKRWSVISFDEKILASSIYLVCWMLMVQTQLVQFSRYWIPTLLVWNVFFCSYLYNVNEKARHDLIWTLIPKNKKFRWGISKSHLYRWHLHFE